MRNQAPHKPDEARPAKIEEDYSRVFTPHPLPYHGIFTEQDSLEQPSQLIYVPSTTTPTLKTDAKLV
jgi:hypothetical protein